MPLFGNLWDSRAAFLPVLLLSLRALMLLRRQVPESRTPTSLHRGGIIVNLVFVSIMFVLLFLIVTNGIRSGESLLAVAAGALGVVTRGPTIHRHVPTSRYFQSCTRPGSGYLWL